jgi:hypothetical protein
MPKDSLAISAMVTDSMEKLTMYENWRARPRHHPEEIRKRIGLGPDVEVEFYVEDGSIVLRKHPENWTLNAGEDVANPASRISAAPLLSRRGRTEPGNTSRDCAS